MEINFYGSYSQLGAELLLFLKSYLAHIEVNVDTLVSISFFSLTAKSMLNEPNKISNKCISCEQNREI